jgi:uncharacterized protein YecE (DUF72 family)
MHPIRIGTTGWSFKDWVGPFYPTGTAPGDYLACYADCFDLVEVDSTFYRIPSTRMVQRWAERTPDEFAFSLKAPRSITHERVLVNCDEEMEAFTAAVATLGEKLKCVLLQFQYFNRATFSGPRPFFERLDAFLARYADRLPLACEIRNKAWLRPEYFSLLRQHGVVPALIEHAWLPPVEEVLAQFDVLNGSFSYVRLIGDRYGIEEITKTWERTVVDRSTDIERVADAVHRAAARAEVLVLVNNHYAGHAPATCRLLRSALQARGRA